MSSVQLNGKCHNGHKSSHLLRVILELAEQQPLWSQVTGVEYERLNEVYRNGSEGGSH